MTLLMNTNSFTIAFWVKTNSTGKTNGHFVMGLAGWNGIQYEIFGGYDGSKFAIQYQHATGTAAEDMWFPALADLGWQGWTYAKSLTAAEMIAKLKDNWYHVVYTYNAPTKVGTLYFDGVKMKSFDFNLWPDGDAKRGVTGSNMQVMFLTKKVGSGVHPGRNNRTISDDWADYANPANNHFKGQLDDIRIWHKAITEKRFS
ncbi:MAG: LamG-like jellyroll fold domain-containing protein [Bacteroidales bacterium]